MIGTAAALSAIPGVVPGWRARVGARYKTARWARKIRFADRDYEAAGRVQVPWPEGLLYNVYAELPEVGHPLTIARLDYAFRLMCGRVAKYARARGLEHYRAGRIVTTGFYRPPGTTWGLGKFKDPHGVIDSTDPFGHWLLAVDISLARTAASFSPRLKRSSVFKCLMAAGLIAPFGDECWHWRPKASLRRRWKGYPKL